jgi:hypothetical protein
MVWQFVDVFKRVYTSNRIQDDDFSDRLNHRYTVAVLVLFFILIGSSQFVGSPIGCWAPAHFTGSMVQYTNYICWISNTYYVPSDAVLPGPDQPRQFRINYYQWVPFILSLMSLLFYVPFLVWRFMARPSCFSAKTVMKLFGTMDASNSDSRDRTMRNVVKLIDRAIDFNRDYYDYSFIGRFRRSCSRCFLPNNHSGTYVSMLYMCTKLLYVINVCGQFFMLNAFMGPKFNLYGFHVIHDLWRGKDFWESERFPRVTMCDFSIRTLGENNQKNTIQCTLPINLFNEKLFIFIWFWLCLVAAFSVYSLIVWVFNLTSSSRINFVKRYLKCGGLGVATSMNRSSSTSSSFVDNKIFDAFMFEYLKQDGVFLLRIVKKNTNDLVVGELVCALWDHFKSSPKFCTLNRSDESIQKADTDKLVPADLKAPAYQH